MKSIVTFFGISTCCLTVVVTAAQAEPTVLADSELDGVTAGQLSAASSLPGLFIQSPLSLLYPPPPREPGVRIPVEGPGCNTGFGPCDPGSVDLTPVLAPATAFPTLAPSRFTLDPIVRAPCGLACT